MGLLRLHRTAGRHSNPKPPQHVHSEIEILRKREQNALLGEVSRVYALATPLCAPIDEKIGHGAEQVSGVVRNDAVLGERTAGVLRLLRELECEITTRVDAPADLDELDGARGPWDRSFLLRAAPKGRGLRFDRLAPADLSLAMSHVNSEPRGALGFATPARAFRAMLGADAEALLDAYGVEDVPVGELDLTPGLIARARAERSDAPLS